MAKAKAKAKKTASRTKKVESNGLASFKLPKAIRNFGPMKDLMKSDLGREILADALIAAAAAAAAALTRSAHAKRAGSSALDAGALAGRAARDAVQTASGAVAEVVAGTARHFLPASLTSHYNDADEEDEVEAPVRRRAPARRTTKAASTKRAAKRPQYVNMASNHSKRKTSKKAATTRSTRSH